MTKQLPMRADTKGLGPAMLAISERERIFVEALFDLDAGHGAIVAAARLAGFANGASPHVVNSVIQKILTKDTVQAALKEMTAKKLRSLGPEAVRAISQVLADRTHKDRVRAAFAVVERIEPSTQTIAVEHTHKIDHEAEALDQLRFLKTLNVAHEKLIEIFGANGLPRLERQLAIADQSKTDVIDADFEEVAPEKDFSNEQW